ncbi:unnamed protein product [Peniophora sp. CBMAI 1063]|nr:unnamed protein product [Peniophora sp. CBMAI 1063]
MSDRPRSNEAGSSRKHTQGPRRPSPERNAAPNPYTTLPPPTTEYITLYIKLQRRRQCFRIVEVPSNYTFALLHTLLRFLFGLSDKRHYFEVVDHVIFHKQIRGQIHNCGRWSKFHQERLPEFIAFYPDHCGDSPVMRVSPPGTREGAPVERAGRLGLADRRRDACLGGGRIRATLLHATC